MPRSVSGPMPKSSATTAALIGVAVFAKAALAAMARELARHSVLASWDKGLFKLALPQDKRPLATQKERLAGTLSEYFGRAVKIEIELTDNVGESVAVRDNRVRDEKQAAAEAAFMADPAVQVLLSEGGGRVRAGSIQATES